MVPAVVLERLLDLNLNTLDGVPATPAFSSIPFVWKDYNGSVYFPATQQTPGYDDPSFELWKTDGTAAGTVLVKDIQPGYFGSNPGGFTVSNGKLFFAADDGTHGRELWKTDGTTAGTGMVKNIYPIAPNGEDHDSSPGSLTDLNGVLYFSASNSVSTYALWKSDGTDPGTSLIYDFKPGNIAGPKGPSSFQVINNVMVFTAAEGAGGRGLWRSDGTTAGTFQIADPDPTSTDSTISNITVVNNTLFFTTSLIVNNAFQYKLWVTDGTAAGTTTIATLSSPSDFTAFNSALYFTDTDSTHGRELWRSDGTPGGTGMLADLYVGTNSSSPDALTVARGTLFFTAYVGQYGNELWKSDGTAAGTAIVADLVPGFNGSSPQKLVGTAGSLYFSLQNAAKDEELWKSDGTAAGTVRVTVINPGLGTMTVANELPIGNGLYFSAVDTAHGRELWHTDGTAAGTAMVKDINTITADSSPVDGYAFTQAGSTVYFSANDGVHGEELWKTDGTAAGTALVKDIKPGAASGLPGVSYAGRFDPVAMGGILYFAADDGVNGRELWRSDGTAAGTSMVANPPIALSPRELTVWNGRLYFAATGSTGSTQLWQSDGTAAGTTMVFDVAPSQLTVVGNTLFFAGSQGSSFGLELWKSDGTFGGTTMVKDIYPGPTSGVGVGNSPKYMTNVGGILYFVARDDTHGIELWRSDGSPAGTTLVKDIKAGIGDGFMQRSAYSFVPDATFTVLNGVLYFGASDAAGAQLWRSDGTATGTYKLTPNASGMDDDWFLGTLAVLNGAVYFEGGSVVGDGYELWKTDGTPAGTVEVKNIMVPEPFLVFGSMPMLMTPYAGQLYFTADDWDHGRELWKTDGTTAKTVMVKDINDVDPGFLSAYPGELTTANGSLYFSSDDGRTGREIWTLTVVPPTAALGKVAPDPRNIGVAAVNIVFSDAVSGFDLSDLALTRGGTSVSLTGATLTTVDNVTWTLGNLTGVTGLEGTYTLTLRSTGAGIIDKDGILLAADATTGWSVDTTPPSAPALTAISTDTGASDSDGVTSDPTLVIVGTAEAGSTVTVSRNGTSIGTTSADGSGAWTFDSGNTILSAGTFAFTARAIDLAGNVSADSIVFTVVLDTAAPAVPAVTAISADTGNNPNDGLTTDQTLVISGSAEAGSSVTVFRNGASIGTVSADGTGGWSFDATGTVLSPGTYAFTARASDVAGNTSAESQALIVAIDTTAPVAAVTAISADTGASATDRVTSDPTLVISGNAEPGSTVTVLRNGSIIGTAFANASGTWSLDSTATTLSAGTYAFRVRAADQAGNVSADSAPFTVLVDTSAPAAPAVAGISTDSGANAGDGVTNDQTLVIFGTADPSSIVTVFRNGASIGTAFANGAGAWSFDATDTVLSAGTYLFAARAADLAGNVSGDSASFTAVVETTAPPAPSVTEISTDTGVSSGDRVTSDPTLVISGFAEAFSTVTVDRDAVSIGTVSADGSGAWTFDYSGTVLSSGTYAFTARAADLTGNISPASAAFTVIVDTIAPAVPAVLGISVDTGMSASDRVTSDPSLVISGSAEAGSSVTVTLDGASIGTTSANGAGAWTFDATSIVLADGNHAFAARAVDLAGNISAASGSFAIVVDSTAPAPPTVSSISNDTGASTSDHVTSDQTLVISGTAEAGSTMTVYRNGASIGTVSADNSGAWSFDSTGTLLSAGTHTFTASAVDQAGNAGGPSAAFLVVVDAAAPAAPSVTGFSTDTGISATDRVTNDQTLTVFGSAEPDSTVTVYRNGATIGTASANGSGAWSFDASGTVLADGTYSFTARASDLAGNVSAASATLVVVVDTASPATPAVTGLSTDTGVSATDHLTSDPTLVISGAAEANSRVTVYRNGASIGTVTANAAGAWSLDSTGTALSAGTYAFTAREVDVAGNASADSAAFIVTIDTAGPAAPVVTGISTDTGASGSDRITSDSTLVISGTAEPASVVTVLRNGTNLGTISVNESGVWSLDYTGTVLPSGASTFTARATDAAGNDGDWAAFNVVVDTAAPRVALLPVTPDPRTSPVGQLTLVFGEAVTGFELADLGLTRDGVGVPLSAASLTSSDNITWTVSGLEGLSAAPGRYILKLTAAGSGIADPAGNPLAGDATTSWFVAAGIVDGNLVVVGTAGNDVIAVEPTAQSDQVRVSLGGVAVGAFDLGAITGRILLQGLAGDDRLSVAANMAKPAELHGGPGNDTLTGGAGNDILVGEEGNDVLIGAAGDDTYVFDTDTPLGSDSVNEQAGGGMDMLDFSATSTRAVALNLALVSPQAVNAYLTLRLSSGAAIENASGSAAADRLIGNVLNNTLLGNGGNDVLLGGRGNDLLDGGAGRDLLAGGSGVDALYGDSIQAGTNGDDVLIGGRLVNTYYNEATGAVNVLALTKVMQEWSSGAAYARRVAHLAGSLAGGLNGSYRLSAATVTNDSAADALSGSGGVDWFFFSRLDAIRDFTIPEKKSIT